MNFKIKSLLLLLCAAFCFNTFAANINVLTLNTWMIPIQGKKAKARAQVIGKETARYDLVFFQEAFRRRLRKKILAYSSDEFKGTYIAQVGNVLGSGLYNLSKLKITKHFFMPFFSCGGIQCAASKGVLYMQVKLANGMIIDTFNTHLQAYEKDAHIRKKQLDQTMKFINHINDGTYPILFVGDFNIVAENSEYSVLEDYLIGYTDAWLDYRPSDQGFTWNPYANPWAEIDEDESTQKQRIDYIFVKDGKEHKWNILESNIEFKHSYQTYSGNIFASDHYGLSAQLELN